MTLLPWRDTLSPLRPVAPVDAEALEAVQPILVDVRDRGESAVREHAVRFGDLETKNAPLVYSQSDLLTALGSIDTEARGVLTRTSARIESFAQAQRQTIRSVTVEVPGGRAGDCLVPVVAAGCYAPGGRYPLPSSVLMTAVTARAAGVKTVWVASPRPTDVTLAAAAVAGADGLLAAGGAQAIAALAFGAGEVPACDVVVGPGNRWVTAAKYAVSGSVGIDLIAGPSELLLVATPKSDPGMVAADLIAQAEHDMDALPLLLVWGEEEPGNDFVARVRRLLENQLVDLPGSEVAQCALQRGWAHVTPDADAAVADVERVAPEHLQLHSGAESLANRLSKYGGVFIGAGSAEVFGDYGFGPNHTLPTGGSASYTGGLSVHTFLRRPTWMELRETDSKWRRAVEDSIVLARLEGLEGHARAAECRLSLSE